MQKWLKRMSLNILNLSSGLVLHVKSLLHLHFIINKGSCYSLFVNVIEIMNKLDRNSMMTAKQMKSDTKYYVNFFEIHSQSPGILLFKKLTYTCIYSFVSASIGKILLQHNKIFMASFFSEPFCIYRRQKSDIQH